MGDLRLAEASCERGHQLRAVDTHPRALQCLHHLRQQTDIETVLEVAAEQSFDGRRSLTLATRKANHSMGELGVGRALLLREVELNPDRPARLGDSFEEASRSLAASKLALEECVGWHSVRRQPGLQLERTKAQLCTRVRIEQGALEPALTNEAPGAGDVRENLDLHRGVRTMSRKRRPPSPRTTTRLVISFPGNYV